MKKIIVLSFATLVLLTTAVSPIQAVQESSAIPAWFSNAIQPIKDILATLISKTDSFEARIAELEKKVDFEVPTAWSTEFYEASINDGSITTTTYTIKMLPSNGSPLTIPNTPSSNCTWNGSIIDSYVTARAIAHLPTGDMYGVGSCREITFKSNVILTSGTTFETDIYLWWQGTEKHTKQTVAIPERPFRSLLTVAGGGSLLISPSSNGMLTIQGTGTIGIGTTYTAIQIDCSSWNCNSDLLRINN